MFVLVVLLTDFLGFGRLMGCLCLSISFDLVVVGCLVVALVSGFA